MADDRPEVTIDARSLGEGSGACGEFAALLRHHAAQRAAGAATQAMVTTLYFAAVTLRADPAALAGLSPEDRAQVEAWASMYDADDTDDGA